MNEHTQQCEILIGTVHEVPARMLVPSKKFSKIFNRCDSDDINITITVNITAALLFVVKFIYN